MNGLGEGERAKKQSKSNSNLGKYKLLNDEERLIICDLLKALLSGQQEKPALHQSVEKLKK